MSYSKMKKSTYMLSVTFLSLGLVMFTGMSRIETYSKNFVEKSREC